jgi:hypothetical protein
LLEFTRRQAAASGLSPRLLRGAYPVALDVSEIKIVSAQLVTRDTGVANLKIVIEINNTSTTTKTNSFSWVSATVILSDDLWSSQQGVVVITVAG